jgi:putative addiction module killer protein
LRIYYAEDGETIVLLLGGGQKDSQAHDIDTAKSRLKDYLARKEQENG